NKIQSQIEFKQTIVHVLTDLDRGLVVHLDRIERADVGRFIDVKRAAQFFATGAIAERVLKLRLAGAREKEKNAGNSDSEFEVHAPKIRRKSTPRSKCLRTCDDG